MDLKLSPVGEHAIHRCFQMIMETLVCSVESQDQDDPGQAGQPLALSQESLAGLAPALSQEPVAQL